jgi:hypothetical protein
VGSCFNAFAGAESIEAYGVDLAPAKESVLRADFLQTTFVETAAPGVPPAQVPDVAEAAAPPGPLQLQSGAFDVVVFNLLLTYLPSPQLRYT